MVVGRDVLDAQGQQLKVVDGGTQQGVEPPALPVLQRRGSVRHGGFGRHVSVRQGGHSQGQGYCVEQCRDVVQ